MQRNIENSHENIEPQVIEPHNIEERVDERIANNYAFLLMKKPPEVDKCFEHPTTVISPEGVFQWNPEIEQWTCRLSAENFNAAYQDLNFLLQRATEITNTEGKSAYTLLTLKQLKILDQALCIHHGDTIIGYTICEEIYLRQINFLVWLFFRRCSKYDYPPLPEAYSKRLLTFMFRSIVIDIAASLRVSAQSFILYSYVQYVYFKYTNNQDDGLQLYNNNTLWFLLSFCAVIVLSLLLLRGGCVDKSYALSSLIRLRFIEQFIISMMANLLIYGPFIVSTNIIKFSFPPLIVLAGFMGYYKNTGNVINIAQLTIVQFLLRIFFYHLRLDYFLL